MDDVRILQRALTATEIDDIANPLTAMEQISYLLFMRRLDATDRKREEDAKWLKQQICKLKQ